MTRCEHINDMDQRCLKRRGHEGDHVYPEVKPLDLRRDTVEVKVRHDGRVIWVNTKEGCVCRISGINELILEDERATTTME